MDGGTFIVKHAIRYELAPEQIRKSSPEFVRLPDVLPFTEHADRRDHDQDDHGGNTHKYDRHGAQRSTPKSLTRSHRVAVLLHESSLRHRPSRKTGCSSGPHC